MCFVQAAEHAAGFGQNEDAKNRYERALELEQAYVAGQDALPPGDDDASQPEVMSWLARFDLRLALVRRVRGDNAGARALTERALAGLALYLLQVAIALNNVAEVELNLGESAPALEHARRAVALGERVAATSELPDMYKNLALASLASSDYPRALDAAERGLELAAAHGIATYLPESAFAAARVVSAATERGDPDVRARARQVAARVLEVAGGKHDEPFARARELLAQFSS